ncbi:YciI family protein [Hamadaea sp. NPDC050747]|uniref:YciI family protein n=1 Tax=Hamadaea sp. NPDC050747 TaxID=3155789 RepID=UPI003405E352
MYVVQVTYTAPLPDIDPLRPAHGAWLTEAIAAKILLMAGRQVPLTGGVYLVADMPRAQLDQLLATDPYLVRGVAEHTVTEFTPLLVAEGLESLRG